jgi:uncharacterized protein YbaA (DUF1428 family)
MSYVDGFVVPVPRKNLAAYRRMARKAGNPRLAEMMDPKSMPSDGKRLIYGGFKILITA